MINLGIPETAHIQPGEFMQARTHQLTVQMSYRSQAHTHGQDHTWPVQLLSTLIPLTVGSSHSLCIIAAITSLQFFDTSGFYSLLCVQFGYSEVTCLLQLCSPSSPILKWFIHSFPWGPGTISTSFIQVSSWKHCHPLDSHGLGGASGFTMLQLADLFLYFIQSSHPAKRWWVLWKQSLHHWWGH